MVPVEDWLLWMLGRRGDPYVYGAENTPGPVPAGTPADCSELLQWAGDSAGVTPAIPDGSYQQWAHIQDHGTVLTVGMALTIRGAALFTEFDLYGPGHVAVNLGDGTTIEARGKAWGIGSFPATTARFQGAGLFPGIDYNPGPTWPADPEDDMRQWTAPLPWRPPENGREAFLVVSEVPGQASQFTVAGVNGGKDGASCWSPPWADGQDLRLADGTVEAHDSVQVDGLWVRTYLIATGRVLNGGLCYEDHVVVACEGGGTYEVARKP